MNRFLISPATRLLTIGKVSRTPPAVREERNLSPVRQAPSDHWDPEARPYRQQLNPLGKDTAYRGNHRAV